MIAHLLRALFRAADARIDRHVAAALDDTTALAEAVGVYVDDYGYQPDPLADPCDDYDADLHRVVSEITERMADARLARFGDEDVCEWEREMAHMAEGDER